MLQLANPASDAAAERTEFAFVTELGSAIEAFTAGAVSRHPLAFHYRGADLRFAVERALYFRFVNSDELHDDFRAGASLDAALPKRLLAFRVADPRGWRHPRRALRAFAGGVRARLFQPGRVAGPPVLIHVLHEKFIRYMQPVVDSLRVPSAQLLALDTGLESVMSRDRVAYLDARAWRVHASSSVSHELLKFMDVVDCYDRFHAALSRLRPACMVLVEGNAPHDETMNQACRQLGIRTVCIQQGWSPFVHAGFRNMSYSRMAVWGEGFAELLRPHNPDQQFVVTGHPRLAPGANVSRDACRAEPMGIGFFLQGHGRLLTSEVWSSFFDLISQTAVEFPARPIFVREHPGEPLDDERRRALSRHPNVQLAAPHTDTLDDLMPRLGLAVSVYSTVILESIAAGVLPLVVNLTSMPAYWPDVAQQGAGIEVHSTLDALVTMRRVLADNTGRARLDAGIEAFRRRFFDVRLGAADRIAGLIAECTRR